MEQRKTKSLQEWLNNLQQDSWQLELIISGLVLFGIYESRPWIQDLSIYFRTFEGETFEKLGMFFVFLLDKGWVIFFINMLTHLVLRGLWIGAIGLRYVSQDIDYEALNYGEYFTKYLKKRIGSYDDFIERLEKTCSIIFAYTFLLFLLLMSLMTVVFIPSLLALFRLPTNMVGLFAMVYFLLGLVVFVDFITMGALKRIKDPVFAKIYMPLYRIFSTITLSFLYRPLLYNFIDDKYTRRLFYMSIPYIFLVLFSHKLFVNDAFPYWSSSEASEYGEAILKMQYEDERQKWYDENQMKKAFSKKRLPLITISQFVVDKPYLEIFLRTKSDDQKLFERDSLIPLHKANFGQGFSKSKKYKDSEYERIEEKYETKKIALRDSLRIIKKALRKDESNQDLVARKISLEASIVELKAAKEAALSTHDKQKVKKIIAAQLKLNDLKLDGNKMTNLDCYMYEHPNFNEKGILCMYPTDSLSKGKHMLTVDRRLFDKDNDTYVERVEVPFYMTR